MNLITTDNNGFDKNVLDQAIAAKRIRTASLAANRLDLRGKTVVTFAESAESAAECAYSLYKTGTGWQLGIHVADVCEYVCEGSPLDIEARKRRCTVRNSGNYDREMLPETIADLCNLSQPVDKLAISTILELDDNFNIVDSLCEKSIIRVATVCIFSEIDKLQTAGDSSSVMLLREKYSPFLNIINNMYEIAANLCMARVARNGLDCTYFRRVYIKDDRGKITSFKRVAEADSRAMLREIGYFVAAAVGSFMKKRKFPCIFNGRGAVDEATLNYLSDLVNADKTVSDPAKRVADITELAKGTSYYDFVCDILAESVPRAEFSVTPINNSFCGADTVVSFFNPVSKYTDLLIQRTIHTVLEAKDPRNLNLNRQAKILADVCAEANDAELFIHNTRKEYLRDCAIEYIKNNPESSFSGFPVHLNEDKSVLVLLSCGILGTIPADKAENIVLSPAEAGEYKVLSAENQILLQPI